MHSEGSRLRDLRLMHGMTQKDFAQTLGTPQSHISAIERGLKNSPMVIHSAAYLFNTPAGFFDAPSTPYSSGSLNFRTKKIPARVMDAARVTFAEIERTARHQLTHWPQIPVTDSSLEDRSTPLPISQINDIAQRIRSLLQVNDTGPVLNVTRAIERSGVPVIPLHNPHVDLASIDGISSPDTTEERGVVTVTDCFDGGRARFTRAHELGHLVLHTHFRPGIEKLREEEAHMFAGAFLMPEDDARRRISSDLTLEGFARLKAEYAISIAALIRRARELNIISPDRYRSLMIQLSSRGWRKDEPVRIPVETPKLLEEVAITTVSPKPVKPTPAENAEVATVTDLFTQN